MGSLIKQFIIMITITAAAVLSCTAAAASATGYEWGSVPVGANGFVTGVVAHPKEKNLVYCRTDVGGIYRYDFDNEIWIPLCDSFDTSMSEFFSVDGIALDPNDSDVVYIAAGGKLGSRNTDILRSEDRGKTWTQLHFEGASFDGNGPDRGMGECIAVDPNNSNILYVGTCDNGLWKSEDRGASWKKIYNSESNVRSIVFDETQFLNGATQKVYFGGRDQYLMESSDGGETWTKVEGSPKTVKRMSVSPSGIVYMASETGLFKYSNSTVTEISPYGNSGMTYNDISIDPNDENKLICLGPHTGTNFMGIPFWVSTDGGNTWTNKYDTGRLNSDLSWNPINNSRGGFSSNAHRIMFDPFNEGRVWLSDWFGVYKTDDIYNGQTQSWTFMYKGIEEVCPRTFLCPPSGSYHLIAGIADIDGVVYWDYTQYPMRRIREHRQAPWMMGSTSIAMCEEDPNIVVRVGIDYNSSPKAEISLDGTKTWTDIRFTKKSNPYQTYYMYQLGMVAVSAQKNPDTGFPTIVVIPSGRIPIISYDLGQTWEEVIGITDTNISTQYWDKGTYLAADKVNGSKFYIADRQDPCNIYVSEDWGKTWTKTASLNGAWYVDKTYIKTAPGMEGVVWCCAGGRVMYRSTDGGKTFNTVMGVNDIESFGFGKNAEGSKYPAVYVYADISGVKGIFRSDDFGGNWVKISDDNFPIGDNPIVMEGDRQTYGLVYVGTGGRGIFYGRPEGTEVSDPPPEPPSEDNTNDQKYSNLFTDEQSLNGWRHYYYDWRTTKEQYNGFSIRNGKLANSWNNNEFGNIRYSVYDKEMFYDGLDLHVRLTADGSSVGNKATVIFGFQSPGNYYAASFSATGNTVELYKYVNEERMSIKSVNFNMPLINFGIDIRICVNNGTITILIGGEKVMEAEDSTFTGGKIGLGCENSAVTFDNLSVESTDILPAEKNNINAAKCILDEEFIDITANISSADDNGMVVVASYSDDGRMVGASIIDSPPVEEYCGSALYHDVLPNNGAVNISIYYWDKTGTIKPLCPPYRTEAQEKKD